MQSNLRNLSVLLAASLVGPTLISAARTQRLTTHHPTQGCPAYSTGMASWYGKQHQGRKMANGQKFDQTKLTAASWTLPLGAAIRVINLANGKSIVVTVTDRGPNRRLHRLLDLSEAAATQLSYVQQGVTPVFYSPASFETQDSVMDARLVEPATPPLISAQAQQQDIVP